MRLLAEVISYAHYGHHMLLSAGYHHSLPFHHRGIDGYTRQFLQLLQAPVISLNSISLSKGNTQLRVESRKEAGHEVVKAIEDTEGTHQRHGGNGNTNHRDAANDVNGIVALLAEDIPAGYEEGEVHFFSNSSMCST